MSLIDVVAASSAEASVNVGLQPTESATNKVDLCDELMSENDAGLHGKPLSELHPPEKETKFHHETSPGPDTSANVPMPVDPLAEQTERTDEDMKLEGLSHVGGPLADTTPSWASPEVVVDAAPTWASAVVTATVPMATLDNIPTEPSSEVAELPPSEVASLESIHEQRVPDPEAEALILELQFSIQEQQ